MHILQAEGHCRTAPRRRRWPRRKASWSVCLRRSSTRTRVAIFLAIHKRQFAKSKISKQVHHPRCIRSQEYRCNKGKSERTAEVERIAAENIRVNTLPLPRVDFQPGTTAASKKKTLYQRNPNMDDPEDTTNDTIIEMEVDNGKIGTQQTKWYCLPDFASLW
jgi:hypothetical protein